MTTMTTGGIPTRPRVKPTHSRLLPSPSTPMAIGCATLSIPTMTTMVGVMQTKPCANLAMLGLHLRQGVQQIPGLFLVTITLQT